MQVFGDRAGGVGNSAGGGSGLRRGFGFGAVGAGVVRFGNRSRLQAGAGAGGHQSGGQRAGDSAGADAGFGEIAADIGVGISVGVAAASGGDGAQGDILGDAIARVDAAEFGVAVRAGDQGVGGGLSCCSGLSEAGPCVRRAPAGAALRAAGAVCFRVHGERDAGKIGALAQSESGWGARHLLYRRGDRVFERRSGSDSEVGGSVVPRLAAALHFGAVEICSAVFGRQPARVARVQTPG